MSPLWTFQRNLPATTITSSIYYLHFTTMFVSHVMHYDNHWLWFHQIVRLTIDWLSTPVYHYSTPVNYILHNIIKSTYLQNLLIMRYLLRRLLLPWFTHLQIEIKKSWPDRDHLPPFLFLQSAPVPVRVSNSKLTRRGWLLRPWLHPHILEVHQEVQSGTPKVFFLLFPPTCSTTTHILINNLPTYLPLPT